MMMTKTDIRTVIAVSIRFMLDEIDSGRLPINDDQPVTTVVDELVP